MSRVHGVVIVTLLVLLSGCTKKEPAPGASVQTLLIDDATYDKPGPLPEAVRGRQASDTAYLAVVMYPDQGTCKAKVIPDKLILPNPNGTSPHKKVKIEWEIVDVCRASEGPEHLVKLQFTATPIRWIKEIAEFSGSTVRDSVRGRLNPNAGRFPYKVMLDVGATGAFVEVGDPEIEIEGT